MTEYSYDDYSICTREQLFEILKTKHNIIYTDTKITKKKLLQILNNIQRKDKKCVATQRSRKKVTGSKKEKEPVEEPCYQLKPISQEQQNAVNHFAQCENIVLNAVAGSGKTTFVLHLAQQLPNRKFLLLTYNKKLSDETKEKCKKLAITNLRVYTFHACATFLYACVIHTDEKLKTHLQTATFQKSIAFDSLIIDEAQDMIAEFYQLARTIIVSMTKCPQLCIIGDTYQTIYEYKGADKRFIELAPDIYNMPFTQCELSTSYRCTIEMARFINALIGRERIKSNHGGCKPTLITIDNIFDIRSVNAIVRLIHNKSKIYGKNETLVLTPTTKSGRNARKGSHSPISTIMNTLSKNGTDVFVQANDEQELNKKNIDAMQNKISAITYHKSKGLERDCVIVFAFDNTYFKYYNKNSDTTRISNAQYVAITRAKKELILIQQAGYALPFLRNALGYCEKFVINGERLIPDINEKRERYEPMQREQFIPTARSPTDLLRFVPSDIINEAINLLKPQEIRPEEDPIELNLSTQARNGNIEEVAEITGTMIMLEHIKDTPYINDVTRPDELLKNFGWRWNFDNPENACKSAACLNAMQSGYEHKLYQIEKWDWIPEQLFAKLSQRLSNAVGKKGIAECYYQKTDTVYPLHGFVDWTTEETLYEIKCTSTLTDIHVLQLALYAYMAYDDYNKFILYNARTQQTIEIPRHPIEVFKKVVELLWRDHDAKQDCDATFMKQMITFIPKV
jgi:hypothetical protein